MARPRRRRAAAIAEVTKAEPTDQDIQASYDKLFASAEPATEYSAAHILVDTEEKAKAIKAELDGGAQHHFLLALGEDDALALAAGRQPFAQATFHVPFPEEPDAADPAPAGRG